MIRIPIDPDTIRALAAVLVETGLTEIEIADKDSRIRVVRGGGVATAVLPVASAAPIAPVAPAVVQDFVAHPGAVASPMVGVAYLSPEPGLPAFVTVGQQVTAGQTLLLIEAMKTFNQIKAPQSRHRRQNSGADGRSGRIRRSPDRSGISGCFKKS